MLGRAKPPQGRGRGGYGCRPGHLGTDFQLLNCPLRVQGKSCVGSREASRPLAGAASIPSVPGRRQEAMAEKPGFLRCTQRG